MANPHETALNLDAFQHTPLDGVFGINIHDRSRALASLQKAQDTGRLGTMELAFPDVSHGVQFARELRATAHQTLMDLSKRGITLETMFSDPDAVKDSDVIAFLQNVPGLTDITLGLAQRYVVLGGWTEARFAEDDEFQEKKEIWNAWLHVGATYYASLGLARTWVGQWNREHVPMQKAAYQPFLVMTMDALAKERSAFQRQNPAETQQLKDDHVAAFRAGLRIDEAESDQDVLDLIQWLRSQDYSLHSMIRENHITGERLVKLITLGYTFEGEHAATDQA